jgi:hypothetical protein
MEIARQVYPIELYTHTRQFAGTFEPVGALMNDINDPEKGDFSLAEATFTSLDPASQLGTVAVPQVIVRKHDVIFFYFRDKSAHEKFRLMTRTEQIIVHTATFAIKGDFHLGAEQNVRDMFDTMRGDFQAMTDVTIFPLIECKLAIPHEIDLIMVNSENILFYYPATQE